MQSDAVRGQASRGSRQVLRWMSWICFVVASVALEACAGAWTARVCSSNTSGNCNGVSPFPKHYTVKSAHAGPVKGITDVQVRDPECPNGFGEVAVTVVDRENLDVAIYCLSDRPANAATPPEGTMTLPAPTETPPAPPEPSYP